MRNYFEKALKFKAFLGVEVWSFFVRAFFTGIFLFGVEYFFIFVLQGFLLSIGAIEESKAFLPDFFPRGKGVAVAGLLFFGFLRATGAFMKHYLVSSANQKFIRHQRSKVLQAALFNARNLSLSEVMAFFGERVGQSGMILLRVCDLSVLSVTMSAFFLLALSLAPRELFVGIALLLVLILPLRFLNRLIATTSSGLNHEWDSVSSTLVLGMKNQLLLRIYGLTGETFKKGLAELKSYERHFRIYQAVYGLNSAFPVFSGIVSIAVITWISQEYFHTPAMQFVSFVYIFVRLVQGASEAHAAIGDLRFYKAGFMKLYRWNSGLPELRPEKAESAGAKPERYSSVTAAAKSLHFAYPDGETVISGVDFAVGRGEVCLIRGESGSGKSTLVGLMVGILEPTGGRVEINGHPIDAVRDRFYHSMGYVGPEPFLIPGTVRENLLYGHPDPGAVSDRDLWESLSLAEAKEFILGLPGGLDESLKESTQLSTGQKQRISIARAFARRPGLLILDEATANLDPETESRLVRHLKEMKSGMAMIIVSHKDSFNELATRVLEMVPNKGGTT